MNMTPNRAACLLLPLSLAFPAVAARPQNPPTMAFGMLHAPIGQATLHHTAQGVVVKNLGSSGQDGVRISVGSDGWDGFVAPQPLSPGGITECTFLGGMAVPPVPVATLAVANPGSGLELRAGVATASSYTIQAFADRTLIYEKTGHGAGTDQPYVIVGNPIALPSDWHGHLDPFGWWRCDITFPALGPVAIEGGPSVVCDLIRVIPEDATLPAMPLAEVELRSTNTIVLEDERMIGLGHSFGALGQAQLARAPGGNLIVHNLGSSGLDGFTVSSTVSERQQGVDLHWSGLASPAAAPFGANLLIGGTAQLTSGTSQQLGDLRITNEQTGVSLQCENAPAGVTGYSYEVYQAGALVGSVQVAGGGASVFAAQWPDYACVLDPELGPYCTYTGWPIPDWLTITDSAGVTLQYFGDQLRILPQGIAPSFARIEAMTVQTSMLPSIEIVDARPLHDPLVTELGRSCPTASGYVPQNRSLVPPVLGTTWQGEVHNLQPETNLVLVATGLQAVDPGIPLDLLGMPGCVQNVLPLVVSAQPTFGAGSVTYSQPIPNDPTLVGVELFFQAVVDGASNAFGAATTNTIGIEVGQ